MAVTRSNWDIIGSFLNGHIPTTLLLGIIDVIVSYEAFSLIKSSNKIKIQSKNKSYGRKLILISNLKRNKK